MRMKLAGFGGPIFMYLTDGVPFVKAAYVALGYTNFDVICIGAAGGFGGGLNAGIEDPHLSYTYDHLRTYGGAGGGGGYYRKRGYLNDLPNSCAVVVGVPGTDSSNVRTYTDIPDLVDGENGAASSFNGDFCIAAGGEGGKAAYLWDDEYPRGGNGGRGGTGNTDVSGQGALGGTSEHHLDESILLTPGANGLWDPATQIGGGGGGGAGCAGRYAGTGIPGLIRSTNPSEGGAGAYNAIDSSAYAFKGRVQRALDADEFDSDFIDYGAFEGSDGIDVYKIPGAGGGATTLYLNSLLLTFGSRANGGAGYGAILIRLTAT